MLLALLVIAAVATGVGFITTSTGPKSYACMSIEQSGGSVRVTTSGLIHLVGGQYYVTCTEGSDLPTSSLTVSCLTITPHERLAQIGVGASTYYYYLSAGSSTISLLGPPVPSNATEIVNSSQMTISVNC